MLLFVASATALATALPGGYGGHGGVVVSGPSGIVTNNGPIGPSGAGFGYGGHGIFGGVGLGYGGFGGYGGVGGHGIVISGPQTVPATIIGPAGKIVADGLYGVGHGHGW
ncbi:hypothetical protein NQ317_001685 [Molorchus minor]|uniref:Uncharacterized protein n=1 Tax=Molorchus minor TaxID=1323400 RepID=A0ABQ9JIN3_9CUCU|nr:hypothetical protein NQ317_001685 [Molorchus minor]